MPSLTTVFALLLASVAALAQGTGDGTFYAPGTGACGMFNTEADSIVAISAATFDKFPGAGGNPNHNPICGKVIEITFQGKKARGTVTDRCAGCPGPNDVDMTKTLFKQLADESVGRIKGLQWHFV